MTLKTDKIVYKREEQSSRLILKNVLTEELYKDAGFGVIGSVIAAERADLQKNNYFQFGGSNSIMLFYKDDVSRSNIFDSNTNFNHYENELYPLLRMSFDVEACFAWTL